MNGYQKVLAIIVIAVISGQALAFDGPTPPRDIPFEEGGRIYNAYAQTWHPWYAQSMICYYATNLDPNLGPVLATDGIISFGYLGISRVLLNPASFDQVWDSENFNADGTLCAYYWSNAWNTPVAQPTGIVYSQYGWNDWTYLNQDDLILTSDLVRIVGIDLLSNFTYDYAGQFGLGQVENGGIVLAGSEPPSPALSIQLTGSGSGTVTSIPNGIVCPTNCSATFPGTTAVQLLAEANPGSVFMGWNYSGCSPENNSCTVSLSAISTTVVGANFGLDLPSLAFPLPGYTPYNAPIFSIMDHSVNPTVENNGYYQRNGTITAYNGESASGAYNDGKSPCAYKPKKGSTCSIIGYKQDMQGTPFILELLGGYDDEDHSDSPDSLKNVLWYDGHPGYDFGAGAGVSIKASHSGILCVASNRTSPSGSLLWRDPVHCPYARDVLADGTVDKDSWDRWHAFYIMYTSSNYSTWYLHANKLTENIENTIISQGWAEVLQEDVVAYVGKKAPKDVSVGNHLHFEVRTNGNTPIDPYGDGSPGNPLILWDLAP